MESGQLHRRGFLVSASTSLAASSALADSTDQTSELGVAVSVLEFADRWSDQANGLGILLSRAGCRVEKLDLTRSPLSQQNHPQLIAFGSFTNNHSDYRTYINTFQDDLRRFVHRGGVVLEMTQSDQFGNRVKYLPKGMEAVRGDGDLAAVFAIDDGHPVVAPWLPKGTTQLGEDFFGRKNPNWESFERWNGLRVLLASRQDGGLPCLLEGQHGKGRFLLSSLWIDKCFAKDGKSYPSDTSVKASQAFFGAIGAYALLVQRGDAPQVEETSMPILPPTGPMVGHVDESSARLWFRPSEDQLTIRQWLCTVMTDGTEVSRQQMATDSDHDFTALFEIEGLKPDTTYTYQIAPSGPNEKPSVKVRSTQQFRTSPAGDIPSKAVLGFGSCAPSDPNRIWTQVVDEGCEGFVFLGDTPYIDSSDLNVAREKHRNFLSQPEIAEMIAQMPCWGTWDDHDFGKNDGHGDFSGKHICRQAFSEYRANATFGHDEDGEMQRYRFGGGRGIYTSFRRGPLEVFLLDPRWFSRTEPSWADKDQPTCLGRIQWDWLRRELKASTAPFKALATGMIWDDKKNSERDDWHTYRHEREAIFDFIRDEKIAGCFLIGGDIHVSRALMYGPRVGYDLWQFIISPMHDGVIPSLDVPHPNLVHHALEPNVFLRLEADSTSNPPRLTASWINLNGKRVFEVDVTIDELS